MDDMKTKFILHGGFTSAKNDLNAGFYKEMSRYVSDGANILLIYFSRDDEDYDRVFEQDSSRIVEQAGGKKLAIMRASKDNFMEEVEKADVLYMRGGKTEKLLNVLKQHPDFGQAIVGKVVAGSSAGAYILAKYYHSVSRGGVHEGLGLLPVRVVCHYKSSRFEKIDDPIVLMERYPSDLELVVLKDYEWKVFSA